jgi:hypothetical protein
LLAHAAPTLAKSCKNEFLQAYAAHAVARRHTRPSKKDVGCMAAPSSSMKSTLSPSQGL